VTLTIHQLRVLAAVVEHGSFTHAAEALHVTQPAITFQVHQLEKEVGTALFVREGRTISTTAAGFAAYRYACEVLGATDSFRRDLESLAEGELEHIVVGAGPSYSTYVLPELLTTFQQRHPRMRLSLVQTPAAAPAIVQQVRKGQIDVGLAVSARPIDELADSRLGTDEPLIVESALRPITTNQTLTLAELARVPFIRTPPGLAQLTTALDRLLLGAGLGPPNLVMAMNSWDGVKEAVRAGVGLAITLWATVRHEVESGEFRAVSVEGYHDPHEVYLIAGLYARRPTSTPVFRELLDLLRAEVPRAFRQNDVPVI
jgi:DNA-binding transcriptional LysR family regulator